METGIWMVGPWCGSTAGSCIKGWRLGLVGRSRERAETVGHRVCSWDTPGLLHVYWPGSCYQPVSSAQL